MLDKEEIIEITWNSTTKQWYEDKGYIVGKPNTVGYVKIKDLKENSTVKVRPICDYCEGEYETTYRRYNTGRKKYPKDCCGKCAAKKQREISKPRRAQEAFDKLIKICEEKKYTLITTKEEYTGQKMRIKYICPKHGETTGILYNLIKGYGCFQCGRDIVKDEIKNSEEKIIKDIESINGNKLLNSSEYMRADVPNLKIKCKCGNIFYTSYINYKKSTQCCKKCSNIQSKGESIVQKVLEKNNITFISQKRFSDCKDKRSLPFDFYLPDYNLIIEYDGEFHYPKIFNSTAIGYIKSSQATQKHDKIKNDYCKRNNIDLLRIPFWEKDNIEYIINTKISNIK